jgi:hypothetical protein
LSSTKWTEQWGPGATQKAELREGVSRLVMMEARPLGIGSNTDPGPLTSRSPRLRRTLRLGRRPPWLKPQDVDVTTQSRRRHHSKCEGNEPADTGSWGLDITGPFRVEPLSEPDVFRQLGYSKRTADLGLEYELAAPLGSQPI